VSANDGDLVQQIGQELRPRLRPIDLSTPVQIHIIGIGGAGMRAIARILLAMGHTVSGSDRAASVHVDGLVALGATVEIGQAPDLARAAAMVTRSTAVPDTDADVMAAQGGGVLVHSRAEVLAAIVAVRPGILVAGTHGKTTTSSMLAVMLDHAGRSPSFVIGSDVNYFGTGARWTDTESFVVEADESDGTFLALRGAHAVVTSLDPDHLEYYGSADRLEAAFVAFVDSIPGSTAVCIDDADTHVLLGRPGVVTYGEHPDADLKIAEIVIGRDTTSFSVRWHGELLGDVTVGLPGRHNAINAAAAIVLGLTFGLDFAAVASGIAAFAGVARRFEARGTHAGITFVDDYAHLPAEVEAAIATAKAGPWNRVIAAYQPHRFSRTEALGATFATSFRGVDELVLTDIYPSGEEPRAGVTGRIVYDAVVEACPGLPVSWQPTLADVAQYLAAVSGPGDLCLTLGAGDLTTVPDRALDLLRSETKASVEWLHDLGPTLKSADITYNAPIGSLTTYRVGGAALALVQVGSVPDLVAIVTAAVEHQTPILLIGKGSNMLVADRGFRGIAIQLTGEFETVTITGTTVELGAAVSLPVAARQMARASLTGFEWAVGVPGTVGGAIVMNAGGHGSDMAATVTSVATLDIGTGEQHTLTLDELDFGYRQSAITRDQIVLRATMTLTPGDKDQSEAALSEIVKWRREHQPGGQNAGSVFTNPEGDSAGRLIDAAGGKGRRFGSAEVSAKHANFIQADVDGRADDVRALMLDVVDLVQSHAGVVLEAETRLVGFVDHG